MIIPKNKVKINTSLTDLYLFYRYKPFPKENTVPKPYYAKSEYTNHEHSLALKQWREAVLIYNKNVVEYLLKGNELNLGRNLGTVKLVKYKKLNVDGKFNLENYEKKFTWSNVCPYLYWNKNINKYQLDFSKNFSINLCKHFKKRLHKSILENPDFLYEFNDLQSKRIIKPKEND